MATMICLTCHEVLGGHVKGNMKSMSTMKHAFVFIAKHNKIEGIEAKA